MSQSTNARVAISPPVSNNQWKQRRKEHAQPLCPPHYPYFPCCAPLLSYFLIRNPLTVNIIHGNGIDIGWPSNHVAAKNAKLTCCAHPLGTTTPQARPSGVHNFQTLMNQLQPHSSLLFRHRNVNVVEEVCLPNYHTAENQTRTEKYPTDLVIIACSAHYSIMSAIRPKGQNTTCHHKQHQPSSLIS